MAFIAEIKQVVRVVDVFRICPAVMLGLRELVMLVYGYPDSA